MREDGLIDMTSGNANISRYLCTDLGYLPLQGRRGGSAFSGSRRLEALSPSRERVSLAGY